MTLTIVTPVYNDWRSFGCLLQDLDRTAAALGQPVRVLAVDDGSIDLLTLPTPLHFSNAIERIEILHLVRNLGHQRAIAIGLVEAERHGAESVIVMDADGEDRPDTIPALIERHRQQPDHIIVAERGRRRESWLFRAFYRLYRWLFHLLVGATIDFGNYCLIPRARLSRLTYDPNLWNHLAAAIVRSRIPTARVCIHRGQRYAGQSKMNFESLVLHGLSAVSVYADVAFVRVLIGSVGLAALGIIGIIVVVLILLFTDLAIPGWATNAVGILSIIVFQIVIFSSSFVFFILSRRSENSITPALDTEKFIKEREVIYE